MTDMIVEVARTFENDIRPGSSYRKPFSEKLHPQHILHGDDGVDVGSKNTAVIGHLQLGHVPREELEDSEGINRQTGVQVYVGYQGSYLRT
jgi:hypothetical protein